MATTRKTIKDYLVKKGVSDETDQILITELVFNMKILTRFKTDLENGDLTYEKKGDTKLNPAVDGYSKILNNVTRLCAKLGMSVQDRAKLKMLAAADATQLEIEEFINEAVN